MWSFFLDLVRNTGVERTVVVMDSEETGKARRYRIRPSRMMIAWGGSLAAAGIVVALLLVGTPLRKQIPGYGTERIKKSAQLNSMRLQSLQDSLAAQRSYINRLRRLMTGRIDSIARPGQNDANGPIPGVGQQRRGQEGHGEDLDPDGSVHKQSALNSSVFSASDQAVPDGRNASSGLSFPLSPPVTDGFPTRDFDAETGHYGIDVAVSEGEYIRAVGDGYVVWADWTQDGGYTIAVQHADGYLSVYKHNKRLLKSLGERVRAQEPLAVSGNTGAITTGPHLHFEFWRNGLAQDPESYIAGW